MAEYKREGGVSKALNAAWVRPFLFLIFIVVLWDLAIRVFRIPAYQVPGPGDVVAVMMGAPAMPIRVIVIAIPIIMRVVHRQDERRGRCCQSLCSLR